jgi:hypothetical protein
MTLLSKIVSFQKEEENSPPNARRKAKYRRKWGTKAERFQRPAVEHRARRGRSPTIDKIRPKCRDRLVPPSHHTCTCTLSGFRCPRWCVPYMDVFWFLCSVCSLSIISGDRNKIGIMEPGDLLRTPPLA